VRGSAALGEAAHEFLAPHILWGSEGGQEFIDRAEVAAAKMRVRHLTFSLPMQLEFHQLERRPRPEKAEPYRQQILELFGQCRGNLVRVHEELAAAGAELSYPALTAFCRRHGIGYEPPRPAGQYDFASCQEMQHDTSPHQLELAGKKRKAQTASAVLCYSRMLFFQCYPTFQRFDCKVFLTDALRYLGGATARVMIDNTHVVVLRGSGRDMVPVPEMTAFGERFGLQFVAHAIGHANRSGRVERPLSA